jgi:hypothetical protein
MVGRNAKCPCGSGKKYKICCIDKVLNFPNSLPASVENIPGSIFNSNDPKFTSIKDDLRELYHLEKKNPHFLYEISIQLGLQGCAADGIIYAKKALKLCPKKDSTLKNSLLLNLAAMSSQINKHEEGLNYLKLVPNGVSRKTIIEANVRLEIEPWENVIHLYEKAIEEEPTFFLPYEHIISSLPFGDPKRDYLINTAFKNMPDNPRAVSFWANKELLERNYQVLADENWINEVRNFDLENSVEQTTVNFSEKVPTLIGSLELIHEMSRLMFGAFTGGSLKNSFKNSETFSPSFVDTNVAGLMKKYLPSTEVLFKCDLSKRLIDVAVTFGKDYLLEFALENVCDECKDQLKISEIHFCCSYRRIKHLRLVGKAVEQNEIEEAKTLADQILCNSEKYEEDFVNSFLDFLDDEMSPEDVLKYAKIIFEGPERKVEFKDQYEELRLLWNLAIIAGKTNLWSLSETFFRKVKNLELDSFFKSFENGNPSSRRLMTSDSLKVVTDNINLLELYLAVTELAQKKIYDAKLTLRDFIKDSIGIADLENTILSIEGLADWVEEHQKSSTFKNDFRHALRLFGLDFWIGSKPKFKDPTFEIRDIISLTENDSLSSQIKLHETINHQAALSSGDLSEIINSLEELLPHFRTLPENAKSSIISAETYRLNAKTQFDTAPSIMGFCKGLEIFIKNEIFSNFSSSIKSSDDYGDKLKNAIADPKFAQFRSLINFLESGFLELGSAAQCLKLCKGKTSERVELLNDLKHYINQYFSVFMEQEAIDKIEKLSKHYRNPAVHERSFDTKDLELVRESVAELLNDALKFRVVNKAST